MLTSVPAPAKLPQRWAPTFGIFAWLTVRPQPTPTEPIAFPLARVLCPTQATSPIPVLRCARLAPTTPMVLPPLASALRFAPLHISGMRPRYARTTAILDSPTTSLLTAKRSARWVRGATRTVGPVLHSALPESMATCPIGSAIHRRRFPSPACSATRFPTPTSIPASSLQRYTSEIPTPVSA